LGEGEPTRRDGKLCFPAPDRKIVKYTDNKQAIHDFPDLAGWDMYCTVTTHEWSGSGPNVEPERITYENNLERAFEDQPRIDSHKNV
jgi:hypothetical protein